MFGNATIITISCDYSSVDHSRIWVILLKKKFKQRKERGLQANANFEHGYCS